MTADNKRSSTTDRSYRQFQEKRAAFWDQMADRENTAPARYYHRKLRQVYQFLIPAGSSVIELGSGAGDLLASLEPRRGVGVDFSIANVELARARHPELEFLHADVHELEINEKFDYVVISGLANDVWDIQTMLENVTQLCHPRTRVILNIFNKLWQLPIAIARSTGLAQPMLRQNWVSVEDMKNLLRISGFEVISTSSEILLPLRVPVIDSLLNRVLVKLWPFHHLGLTQFLVVRPDPFRHRSAVDDSASVSVLVPARNEAGHIKEILDRLPSMGSQTELIFVEGNSTDDTWDTIKSAVDELGDPNVHYYRQPGVGKGDAVRHGFKHASGEVLMILDADMTVAPEDLPRFFDAISNGSGEFINGVRLVYPMEDEAMQFLNYLGNKFFGAMFSWLLRQPVKDTLCGTKVLSRAAYEEIVNNRSYFGDFDPFGDFDLLFGAAKINLRIIDLPIRYRQRRYGSTNIDRWRHGVLLLRMAWFAARKMRFV